MLHLPAPRKIIYCHTFDFTMVRWCVTGHTQLGKQGPLTAGTLDERPIAVRAIGLSAVGNYCLTWNYLIWAVMVAIPTRSPPLTASVLNTLSSRPAAVSEM